MECVLLRLIVLISVQLSHFESNLTRARVAMVQRRQQGIGFQLWPAAEFLCNYIEAQLQGASGSGDISPEAQIFGIEKVLLVAAS